MAAAQQKTQSMRNDIDAILYVWAREAVWTSSEPKLEVAPQNLKLTNLVTYATVTVECMLYV